MEESTGAGGLSRNFARMQVCDELSSCRSGNFLADVQANCGWELAASFLVKLLSKQPEFSS